MKSKWDIIHYIMLIMNMEESLTEQTGRHLLEVFMLIVDLFDDKASVYM